MAHNKIRLGIIGANVHYGWGARAHLPALVHLPDYEIVALCTAHPETAQESVRQFGVPLAFHNVARMYQSLAEAIRTGQRVEPDFATAVARHTLIEAVQVASDQGERVSVGRQ